MAEVVLINPALSADHEPYAVGADIKMPMGLLYLAASLEQKGHKVSIIDAAISGFDAAGVLEKVKNKNPDLVGISCVSATWRVARTLSKLIKQNISKKLSIVIGGVHATLDPQACLAEETVDFVVAGEGEEVLPALCDSDRSQPDLPGLFYKDREGCVRNGGRPKRILDIDALPYPAYNRLDLDLYFRQSRELSVIASRGCPHSCSYCCAPTLWERQVVFREPGAVVEEITFHLTHYPEVEMFHFLDDNLVAWGEGLAEFCSLVRQLGVKWRCIGCIDDLDKSQIAEMAASGCVAFSFGVESGSERIQEICGKNLRLTAIPAKVKLLSEVGIQTKGFFMLGFPSETREEMIHTINYALELKNHGLADAAFMPLIPYPGTRIYKENTEKKRIGFGEVAAASDWFDHRPKAASKLAKYRIFPLASANEFFSGIELRCIAAGAYETFYKPTVSRYTLRDFERNFVVSSAAMEGT